MYSWNVYNYICLLFLKSFKKALTFRNKHLTFLGIFPFLHLFAFSLPQFIPSIFVSCCKTQCICASHFDVRNDGDDLKSVWPCNLLYKLSSVKKGIIHNHSRITGGNGDSGYQSHKGQTSSKKHFSLLFNRAKSSTGPSIHLSSKNVTLF